MAVMAYWNDMVWSVDRKGISYLSGLTTTYKMTEASNNDKDGKKPTEQTGMDLEEYSFSTVYRIETGTPDVWAMVELWKSKIGKAAPLIIGGRQIGPEKLQLKQVGVSETEYSASGLLRCAKLAFTFVEYAEVKKTEASTGVNIKKTNKQYKSSRQNTASQITASDTDKQNKKPKVIEM